MTHEEEIWALNYSIERKRWHMERLEAELAAVRAELGRAQRGWTRALDELEKADAWASRLQAELAELKSGRGRDE